MFINNKGEISNLKGFEEQIRSSSDRTAESATEDDFSEIMKCLMDHNRDNENITWMAITGYGGYIAHRLQLSWIKYGKQKLPRKLKKQVYLTKKLRKLYLPNYYG